MSTTTNESRDRRYLEGCLDSYLEALAKRDLGSLPLARTAKFTENGQELPLGAGLWATASVGGTFARVIHIVEPAAGQAMSFNVVTENGLPVHLALRLRVQDGLLTEIETLVVRPRGHHFDTDATLRERESGLETLASIHAPIDEAQRMPREALEATVDTYFDGIIQSNGEIVAVDERCIRVEHGVQTILDPLAPQGSLASMSVAEQLSSGRWREISDASRRRYLVVDVERGLVLVWLFFDQVGAIAAVDVKGVGRVEIPRERQRPSSGMMAELFKVRAGRITHIEAFFDQFPYGMRFGWEDADGSRALAA